MYYGYAGNNPITRSATMSPDDPYLRATPIIDWTHPTIGALAQTLAVGGDSSTEIAQRCFVWVRDQIAHSADYQRNPVTCVASDVLAARTGFCYAKSHLLVALCRANGIPAGLCYQRLQTDSTPATYCLHGLVAVQLPGHGWYRVDPRGNRPGINAQFTPPNEQLAFTIAQPGEADFPTVYPDPLPVVVLALQTAASTEALSNALPDLVVDQHTVML
jgi:transglutaminase-like putative cysteine protease